jgi:NTE family protein
MPGDRIVRTMKKIGLALGGGAARGLAHIGTLKVLAEEAIAPDFVAGTSAGSLIGALLCAGFSWHEIRKRAIQVSWSDLVEPIFPIMGLVKSEKLEKLLGTMLSDRSFEELNIPLSVVTVDILTGDEVILRSGSVARAVQASCSIPGLFKPVDRDDRLLVDGGLINNLPSNIVREMGAEVVIAVDLISDVVNTNPPKNIVDILYYSFNIMIRNAARKGLEDADCVIKPDLRGFSYHRLGRLDELMARGEMAARESLSILRALKYL